MLSLYKLGTSYSRSCLPEYHGKVPYKNDKQLFFDLVDSNANVEKKKHYSKFEHYNDFYLFI